MNLLGIETEWSIQNNAAYIQNWIRALRNDKKLIVTAAGKATKAVDLIMPGAMG
jgi:antirestriction protein ArdC